MMEEEGSLERTTPVEGHSPTNKLLTTKLVGYSSLLSSFLAGSGYPLPPPHGSTTHREIFLKREFLIFRGIWRGKKRSWTEKEEVKEKTGWKLTIWRPCRQEIAVRNYGKSLIFYSSGSDIKWNQNFNSTFNSSVELRCVRFKHDCSLFTWCNLSTAGRNNSKTSVIDHFDKTESKETTKKWIQFDVFM